MDRTGNILRIWLDRKNIENRNSLFNEIWDTYHCKLQVYIRQFSHSQNDVSDTASEILLKIFESIDKYNSEYSLSTWIYTIARNHLIDSFRRKEFTSVNADDHILTDSETPESKAMRNSDKEMIREVISTLTSSDRELIYLHFYEELKYSDISRITGIPTGTIKYRMSENRKQIRKKLEGSVIL